MTSSANKIKEMVFGEMNDGDTELGRNEEPDCIPFNLDEISNDNIHLNSLAKFENLNMNQDL